MIKLYSIVFAFSVGLLMCTGVISADQTNVVERDNPSLATAVVNTQILTILNYDGNQVYVYGALSNENENSAKPQKWIFYYVPIMAPVQQGNTSWIWTTKNELRMKLLLGNEAISELVRKAVVKKYDLSIAQNAKFWDVAPLMIDSLMAFIVKGSSSPVEGVHPLRIVHPSGLSMTFRFACSSEEKAKTIMQQIIDGDNEVEVAFYFAGFKQVSTNFVSITGDQLKDVLSKTVADGGSTNATYIHRSQVSKFIGSYVANVKLMIYMENPNANTSILTANLQNQFISLSQQATASSAQTILDAKLFDQVWSATDLNPNRLTNEINKLFTYNKTETERHNDSDIYFNYNKDHISSSSASGGAGVSFGGMTFGGSGATGSSSGNSLSTITNDVLSSTEIQNSLSQEALEVQWTGEKFIPKSFKVYKLTDLTDRLQVAIIAKQLTADKVNGAIIRSINTIDGPVQTLTSRPSTLLTGEIRLYTGVKTPELPWLTCNGAAVSRVEFQRLFAIVGVQYGAGDGSITFNLPDFRGRLPVGIDSSQVRVNHAMQVGQTGGQVMQTLTVDQLPTHRHGKGTLVLATSGVHTHPHTDPGHNHGGATGTSAGGPGNRGTSSGGGIHDRADHTHVIASDTARITIHNAGAHTHNLDGEMDSVGATEAFSLLNPYQVVQYIIYTDD